MPQRSAPPHTVIAKGCPAFGHLHLRQGRAPAPEWCNQTFSSHVFVDTRWLCRSAMDKQPNSTLSMVNQNKCTRIPLRRECLRHHQETDQLWVRVLGPATSPTINCERSVDVAPPPPRTRLSTAPMNRIACSRQAMDRMWVRCEGWISDQLKAPTPPASLPFKHAGWSFRQ
eukprot:2527139-Alexandrium_andersonii.AAC.1